MSKWIHTVRKVKNKLTKILLLSYTRHESKLTIFTNYLLSNRPGNNYKNNEIREKNTDEIYTETKQKSETLMFRF